MHINDLTGVRDELVQLFKTFEGFLHAVITLVQGCHMTIIPLQGYHMNILIRIHLIILYFF